MLMMTMMSFNFMVRILIVDPDLFSLFKKINSFYNINIYLIINPVEQSKFIIFAFVL